MTLEPLLRRRRGTSLIGNSGCLGPYEWAVSYERGTPGVIIVTNPLYYVRLWFGFPSQFESVRRSNGTRFRLVNAFASSVRVVNAPDRFARSMHLMVIRFA